MDDREPRSRGLIIYGLVLWSANVQASWIDVRTILYLRGGIKGHAKPLGNQKLEEIKTKVSGGVSKVGG